MRFVDPSRLLKGALGADALLAAAIAALHLPAAGLLAGMLALPRALLLGTGLFLVAWCLFLGWLARTPRVPALLVALVIDANLLWALAALGLLWTGALGANAWGQAYLVLNAAVVLAFAALEWTGLRRSPAVPAARAAHA